MESTERKLTNVQLACMIFILGMSLKMLVLPMLLIKSSGRDAVIGMSTMIVAELLSLVLLVAAIVLSPHKSFCKLLEECTGKVFSRIMYAVFVIYFFFKLLLLLGEVRVFVYENLFVESNRVLFAVPIGVLCYLFGIGTARAIGRTSQFLFPVLFAATVFMLFMIGTGVDYTGVLPLGESGIKNISRDFMSYSMWHGDYTSLIAFVGALKRSRHTAVFCGISGALASIAVIFFSLSLTAAFGSIPEFVRFGQNVSGISNFNMSNGLHGRFDLLLFCIWMLSIFVKAGIYTYSAVYFFRAIFPCSRAVTAICLAVLLYLTQYLFKSTSGLHAFMIICCAVPALAVQIIVPPLAFIIALVSKKRQSCKEEQNDGEERKDNAQPKTEQTQEEGAESETEHENTLV